MRPTRRESFVQLLRSFTDSDRINSVSEGAEVLYLRLIAASDDAGRYSADPAWIAAKVFTARMIAGEVSTITIAGRLDELERVGLIRVYHVDGKSFLELVNLFRRNRPDVKPVLLFPAPETDSENGDDGDKTGHGTDSLRTRDESVTDAERTCNEFVPLSPSPPLSLSPSPSQPSHGDGSKNGSSRKNRKPGPLADVTTDELRDVAKLVSRHRWLANLKRCGMLDPNRDDGKTLREFVATAIHALAVVVTKGGDPAKLFVSNVSKGRKFFTDDEENEARRLLLEHRRSVNGQPSALAIAGANRLAVEPPPETEDFE